MKWTKRDKIWKAALELLLGQGEFRTDEVMDRTDLETNSYRTVQDTLITMSEMGILRQDTKNGNPKTDYTSKEGKQWHRVWKPDRRFHRFLLQYE